MGYKDGAHEGRESQFQRDFDIGYADGFRNGFILGKFKGISSSAAEKDLILQETARGQCTICVDQSLLEKPIADIRKSQETHMEQVQQTLRSRYEMPEESGKPQP